MEKYYNIAGIPIIISGRQDELNLDDECWMRFETECIENREEAYHYEFQCVEELDDFMKMEKHGRHTKVQVLGKELVRGITGRVVLTVLELERLVAENQAFVLHASYVIWQGKGILFTAPSGTGKTTQAELWHALRGAEIVNGDRAIVRVSDGECTVHGLPYAGSSKYCENKKVPLAAVVYLTQAQQTSIRRLEGVKAFRRIWEGCTVAVWDAFDVKSISEAAAQVAQRVPVYQLDCTPDESAVLALEHELRKD